MILPEEAKTHPAQMFEVGCYDNGYLSNCLVCVLRCNRPSTTYEMLQQQGINHYQVFIPDWKWTEAEERLLSKEYEHFHRASMFPDGAWRCFLGHQVALEICLRNIAVTNELHYDKNILILEDDASLTRPIDLKKYLVNICDQPILQYKQDKATVNLSTRQMVPNEHDWSRCEQRDMPHPLFRKAYQKPVYSVATLAYIVSPRMAKYLVEDNHYNGYPFDLLLNTTDKFYAVTEQDSVFLHDRKHGTKIGW